MTKVFVDTNVIIDILGQRINFYEDSQDFFTYALDNEIELFVSTLSFAITHYILSEQLKQAKVRSALRKFKTLVSVATFDDKILELSLSDEFKDFEDGIQYFIALDNSFEAIITRNKNDFRNSQIPVLSPREFLSING
jgi:predicted nucleic acid-binding protein